MPNNPKPNSKLLSLNSHSTTQSASKPANKGVTVGKEERRSLKGNARSPVTTRDSDADQRRAFKTLSSTELRREGGLGRALKPIRATMARVLRLAMRQRAEL